MAHVLVIDDDAALLDALTGLLEEEGHRVDVAKHGAEALQKLSRGSVPDVVLLDLLMPIMDGWTFLTRMRERPDLASLPVVVMSAGLRASEEAAARGVFCVPKPLCMVALLERVAIAARAAGLSMFPRGRTEPRHDVIPSAA